MITRSDATRFIHAFLMWSDAMKFWYKKRPRQDQYLNGPTKERDFRYKHALWKSNQPEFKRFWEMAKYV